MQKPRETFANCLLDLRHDGHGSASPSNDGGFDSRKGVVRPFCA